MAKKRKISKDRASEPENSNQEGQQSIKEEPESIEEEDGSQSLSQSQSQPLSQDSIKQEESEAEPPSQPEPLPLVPASDPQIDGEDEDDSDPESILQLLEPLPKDQLVELLRDAAAAHPDVLRRLHAAADADPAHRKIFVHGLGWDTTAETLRAAFLSFGEIEDCKAVADKATGRSKGYGFILFKHRSGARRALKEPQKRIGSRMTACQLASAGPPGPPPAPPVSEYTQRKIYISNVGTDIDPQRLLQFFARYGEIEEGPLGLDKSTGKPKGFCLFVYKTVESARRALEEPHKNYEGHVLHCQKAIDGPKPQKPGFGFQHSGPLHHSGGFGAHLHRNENTSGLLGGAGNQAAGPMMAGPAAGLGLNQAAQPVAAGLNPVLGQALTALLASQGGLGLTNLLGAAGIGGPAVNQGIQNPVANSAGQGLQGMYGSQLGTGAYGGPGQMQGGYGNAQMVQGSGGRAQQGMGNMGGMQPYTGH